MAGVPAHRAERFLRQRDGAGLSCVRGGDPASRRAMLFLNGLYSGPEAWTKQRRYGPFRRAFRMILHDYRGFGRSSCAPGSAFGMSELARDAAQILAAEQVDEAVVVGHSIGCAMALACAAEHAGLVRAVVLLAPGLRVGPRLRVMLEAVRSLLGDGVPFARLYPFALAWHHSERYLDKLVAQQARYADAVAGYINEPAALEALYRDLLADDVEDRFTAVAARVHAPVLIISSSEDLIFPPGMQHEVAALLSHSRVLTLDTGGHALQVEQSGTVNHAIEQHLIDLGMLPAEVPAGHGRGGGA
jgi:pimeloyl-ACP methyl ester carboxylesterase